MEQDITKLLEKYIAGEASPEERLLVEQYYNSFARNPKFTDALTPTDKKELEATLLAGILQKINDTTAPGPEEIEEEPEEAAVVPLFVRPVYFKVAAAVVSLLMLAVSYRVYFYRETVMLATKAGEVATYILPDQSKVTLNGNSVLTYTKWGNTENRQVTLKGEAFFSVTHTRNHQKFVVTVPGKMQVEVLGTEFNVTGRHNDARVVLNSGKVKLHIPSVQQDIIMKPGEMVELNPKVARVIKAKANPAKYTSWNSNMLVLDKTTLRDLVKMLENTYGLQVTVTDTALLPHTFSGKMPKQDVDLLLLGLSKAFDLDISKKADQVIIRK